MNNSQLVITAVNALRDKISKDENSRERSWEHCYFAFYEARKMQNPDIDRLSLMLAFYLASWGMYRSSSFVLQKDYKIYVPIVNIVLDKKYDCLSGIKCADLKEQIMLLWSVTDQIKSQYSDIRASVKGTEIKSPISDVLVTKTLLGTLGCFPAFDSCFVSAAREYLKISGAYNDKSINQLISFYKENENSFESLRKHMKIGNLEYPQMRILDMGLWQLGSKLIKR